MQRTSDIDRMIFSKRRFLEDASHATLSREPPVDGPSVRKNLIRTGDLVGTIVVARRA
jgi:hypothetical protein